MIWGLLGRVRILVPRGNLEGTRTRLACTSIEKARSCVRGFFSLWAFRGVQASEGSDKQRSGRDNIILIFPFPERTESV